MIGINHEDYDLWYRSIIDCNFRSIGLLPDWMIKRHIGIDPFVDKSEPGTISYGISSYGYDIRLGSHFKIFTPALCAVVDPKKFDARSFVEVDVGHDAPHQWRLDTKTGWSRCDRCQKVSSNTQIFETVPCSKAAADHVLIPPNSFALGESFETFDIPRDVTAICLGKSTYARCGIIVNMTPLEAEWRGKLTIEISNTTPLPAKVYANEGIAQLLFFRTLADCDCSYADKKGKYQDQTGLTLPKV